MVNRWIRQMMETGFTLATFILVAEFVLRILSPGDADSAGIFRTIQPVRLWLEPVIHMLLSPVRMLLSHIRHWIPSFMTSWFPVMPADSFFRQIADIVLLCPGLPETPLGHDLQNAQYATIFPGVADWRPLMAVSFWGMVESLSNGLLSRLDAFLYRQSLRRRDALYYRQYRQEEALPPPQLNTISNHQGRIAPAFTNRP